MQCGCRISATATTTRSRSTVRVRYRDQVVVTGLAEHLQANRPLLDQLLECAPQCLRVSSDAADDIVLAGTRILGEKTENRFLDLLLLR
jgi:hypothetical protein